MACRRRRAIESHYTDRRAERIDVTQVFRVELFLRYDGNTSDGHTSPLAYVKLHRLAGK